MWGRFGFELGKMPALVHEVVLDEEAKSDRLIFAHDAACLKTVLGDAVDDCCKNLMLHLPPAHERIPGLTGVTVRGHPGILRILWTGVVTVSGGADEALAVVGR